MRRSKLFRDIRAVIARLSRRTVARPAAVRADRGYLICSSPRCGSTYLAELLASTGVLGVPREYFNPLDPWGTLGQEQPGDVRPLFERVLTKGATANGIYGVKSHADHFSAVAGVADPMRALPGLQLVRIRRGDILDQAISWMRAQQTGQFRAARQPKGAPQYDASAIRRLIALIGEQADTWDRLLAVSGCAPLEIAYESLIENPQREVDRVARLMGIRSPVPIASTRIKVTIQRDELNTAWRQRFLAETGGEFRHAPTIPMPPSRPGSASAS